MECDSHLHRCYSCPPAQLKRDLNYHEAMLPKFCMPFFGPVPDRLANEFVCICCGTKMAAHGNVGSHMQECLQETMNPSDMFTIEEDEQDREWYHGTNISPTAEKLGFIYSGVAQWFIPPCPMHALHGEEEWWHFLRHFKPFAELRATCRGMRLMNKWIHVAVSDYIELWPIWVLLPADLQVQRQANWYVALLVSLAHTVWSAPGCIQRTGTGLDHCRTWQLDEAMQDLRSSRQALDRALRLRGGDPPKRKRTRVMARSRE
jgi:hypothetical protein